MAGFIVGIRIGWEFGLQHGGPFGGILGAALGAFVGLYVGWFPFVVVDAVMRKSLTRRSVSELRAKLNQEHDIGDHFVSHIIIAELLKRGEPLESLREIVAAQLASSTEDIRACGQRNAKIWFPDLLGTVCDDNRSSPIS